MIQGMKKLYDKNRLLFAIGWIIVYCVLMSAGDALSQTLGAKKSVTLVIGLAMSAVLLGFFIKNGLSGDFGLCPAKLSSRRMLYYLPVIIMLTANLWYGVSLTTGALETVFYMLSMLCVGFLEEVIFRGLLFEAMRTDNPRAAVIVSAVTFGIGHIVNLVNGSGAELLPNLLQVVYATAAGFMFVMIYLRSGSLLVCIGAHGLFNALSVFAHEASATTARQILTCVLLTLIMGGYAAYLALSFQKKRENKWWKLSPP